MEPYTELKRQAKQKRDLAIDKARAALREIDRLGRKLNGGGLKARYTANLAGDGSDLSIATTIKAAEIVLRECGPMTLQESTLAVQARGHRPGDPRRKVADTIRCGLRSLPEKRLLAVDRLKRRIDKPN